MVDLFQFCSCQLHFAFPPNAALNSPINVQDHPAEAAGRGLPPGGGQDGGCRGRGRGRPRARRDPRPGQGLVPRDPAPGRQRHQAVRPGDPGTRHPAPGQTLQVRCCYTAIILLHSTKRVTTG